MVATRAGFDWRQNCPFLGPGFWQPVIAEQRTAADSLGGSRSARSRQPVLDPPEGAEPARGQKRVSAIISLGEFHHGALRSERAERPVRARSTFVEAVR